MLGVWQHAIKSEKNVQNFGLVIRKKNVSVFSISQDGKVIALDSQ
jgi:hypothetical protein